MMSLSLGLNMMGDAWIEGVAINLILVIVKKRDIDEMKCEVRDQSTHFYCFI